MPTSTGSLPRKVAGLHTRVVGDEVIVLDEATQAAHVLQGPAAALWLTLDQGQWPAGDREPFAGVVRELQDAGLLQAPSLTRRRVLVHGGAVVAAGSVLSLGLPSVAAADSAPSVPTNTSVTASPGTPTSGTEVTFTVTVQPGSGTTTPTGTVSFTRSTSPSQAETKSLGSNGTVTFTAVAGPAGTGETFTATYVPAQGTPFMTSTGSVTVTPAPAAPKPQPTVTISTSTSQPTAGADVTATITVTGSSTLGAPTGRVSLTNNGSAVGTGAVLGNASGASSSATITVPYTANPANLVATYEPDSGAKYSGATSSTTTVNYTRLTPTITYTAPAGHRVRNAGYELTVDVTGPSGSPAPTGSFTLTATEGASVSGLVSSSALANGTRYRYSVKNTNGNPPKNVSLTGSYTAGSAGIYNSASTAFTYTTTT